MSNFNSFDYVALFYLTIVLIIAKALLTIYLAAKIIKKTKKQGEFRFDFIFGFFIFMIGILVSRIIFFYVDFFLVEFNPDKYYINPNITIWKTGVLIAELTLGSFLFIMDKNILKFKLKGIFAYIIFIASIFQFLYPVNSAEDFALISTIILLTNFVFILIPIIFTYIGIKTPEIRLTSFILVAGIIIYAFGNIVLSEAIVAPLVSLYGPNMRITVFFFGMIAKIIGLVLFTYGATKFYI